MLTIGTERFDKTTADQLTRALLLEKTDISKTQLQKGSYHTTAQEWAKVSREMKFADWKEFSKALKSPHQTMQRILDQESVVSWYPKAANPHWMGRQAIPFEITAMILDMLDDQSLAQAQQVNREWRAAADEVMLPPSQYKTVIAEGKRENLSLTPQVHRSMALDAFRRAKMSDQIVLYRQMNKKAFLTEEEIGKYTVSSFPWTPEKTAAWILGGIQSRKTFIVITEVTASNLKPDKEYGVPVLSRELTQLLVSGYTPSEGTADKTLSKLVGKRVLIFSPSDENITYARLNWQEIWDRAAKALKVAYPNNVTTVKEITNGTLPSIIEQLAEL